MSGAIKIGSQLERLGLAKSFVELYEAAGIRDVKLEAAVTRHVRGLLGDFHPDRNPGNLLANSVFKEVSDLGNKVTDKEGFQPAVAELMQSAGDTAKVLREQFLSRAVQLAQSENKARLRHVDTILDLTLEQKSHIPFKQVRVLLVKPKYDKQEQKVSIYDLKNASNVAEASQRDFVELFIGKNGVLQEYSLEEAEHVYLSSKVEEYMKVPKMNKLKELIIDEALPMTQTEEDGGRSEVLYHRVFRRKGEPKNLEGKYIIGAINTVIAGYPELERELDEKLNNLFFGSSTSALSSVAGLLKGDRGPEIAPALRVKQVLDDGFDRNQFAQFVNSYIPRLGSDDLVILAEKTSSGEFKFYLYGFNAALHEKTPGLYPEAEKKTRKKK